MGSKSIGLTLVRVRIPPPAPLHPDVSRRGLVVRAPAQAGEERFAPRGGFLRAVQPFGQPSYAAPQLLDAHLLRPVVDVEQSAQVPPLRLKEPALGEEPVVERRSGERRQDRDL